MVPSEVDRRHGSCAARLHPHDKHVGSSLAILRQRLDGYAEIAESGDPLSQRMRGAKVATLRTTASRYPALVCLEIRMASGACLHSPCFRDGHTHLRPR